jgi:hypothetical protein
LDFEEFSKFYEEATHAVVVHAGDDDDEREGEQNSEDSCNDG